MAEETEHTYKEAINKLMDCMYMSHLIASKLIKAIEDNGKDTTELMKVFSTEDKEFSNELFRIFKHFLYTKYGTHGVKHDTDDPEPSDPKKHKNE